jgi:hypothetical protein
MREIRNAVPRPPEDEEIPSEIIYADDTDYISTSREYLETIEAEASRILGDWNLSVNAGKVEKTVLCRREEKDMEEWRKVKKLGTLLGDSEEAKRRKQLASAAFQKLKNIWSNKTNNKISTARRIRLYETYITPILTYNAGTWALTKKEIQQLDAFRRRHFRLILGICYPNIISNKELYRRCKAQELDTIIRTSRWKLLGHTLRMADNTPAKLAMIRYFEPASEGFVGRPRTTIPVLLNNDLKEVNPQTLHRLKIPAKLNSLEDLWRLERHRGNILWRSCKVLEHPSQTKRLGEDGTHFNNNNKPPIVNFCISVMAIFNVD